MKTKAVEAPRESPEHFAALAAAVHPDWHDAIQRLADAITCVSCQIDNVLEVHEKHRSFTARCGDLITNLIDLLDKLDPDPDLEPTCSHWTGMGYFSREPAGADECEPPADDEDGADDEPSLGSHEIKEGGVVVYMHRPIVGGGEVYLDGEEQCDDEGARE